MDDWMSGKQRRRQRRRCSSMNSLMSWKSWTMQCAPGCLVGSSLLRSLSTQQGSDLDCTHPPSVRYYHCCCCCVCCYEPRYCRCCCYYWRHGRCVGRVERLRGPDNAPASQRWKKSHPCSCKSDCYYCCSCYCRDSRCSS